MLRIFLFLFCLEVRELKREVQDRQYYPFYYTSELIVLRSITKSIPGPKAPGKDATTRQKSIKRIWKLEAAGGGITKPDRMRATVGTCSLVTPPAYQTEVVITKIYANCQLNGISLFSGACFLFFVPLDSSFACYYWNVLGYNM